MHTRSLFTRLLIGWICTWINIHHITALRVYDEERLSNLREEVKATFYHAYDSYIEKAYPLDELRPLSCDGVDTWGSYSLTLIDTLDTLAILGNYSEFRRVAQLIIDNSHFDLNINVSVFETNIRIIGGLLSAHLLSQKAGMELEKGWPCNGPLLHLAEKVARKLLPAFDTKTGMPYGTVNLRYGVPAKETPITCTAGVGTFLVEFGTLSRLTGDPLYEKVALRALHSLYAKRSKIDLFGNHIDTDTGRWTALDSGIGAGVDSFFEYLVKGGILFQKPELLKMFGVSYKAIEKHLEKSGWYIWCTMAHGHVSAATFQSLEAYWPGLLSLVGEFKAGIKAITNYHRIWKQYGALPELYNILHGKSTNLREGYPLRPELVESAMYLYRATRDPFMLEIGEDILHSIKTTMRTECGFATVRDVTTLTLEDRMESFFLAETVKYLYLLFDPQNFIHNDGDDYTVVENPFGTCTVYAGGYIFNTEAHPIDPSALHCCTGVSDRELHEEVANVDELRSGTRFHGSVKEKLRKFEPSSVPDQDKEKERKLNSAKEEGSPPQLLKTQHPIVTVPTPPNPIEQPIKAILDSISFDNELNVCQRRKLDSFKTSTCPVETSGKLVDKMSTLEKLLDRLLDEQRKGGLDFAPIVNYMGLDGKGLKIKESKTGQTAVISGQAKVIEELIETFETVESSAAGPKPKKQSHRTLTTNEEQPSNRIQENGNNPDLDLIFGSPTASRSLSLYFSLKWLQKFPELITHLIPSERFDIQNFYSRINKQFTEEHFSKDFNFTIGWTKDYDVLQCDTLPLADRFLFHKSAALN